MGRLANAITAGRAESRQGRDVHSDESERAPEVLVGTIGFVAGLTVAAFLLAVIVFMGPLVEHIPLAVLAAIPIAAGWNLIDWRFIRRLHRIPASFSIVLVATVVLSVFTTLAAALVIGLFVAWLLNARRLEELEMRSLVSVPLPDVTVLNPGEISDADRFAARSGLVVLPDRREPGG